jgi:Flp pilus assembly protein TadG
MVEFAIVTPAVFVLMFGLLIGGLGVSRYEQLAYLAREASRYASVHGAQYATETGQPAADSAAIYNQVIKAKGVGLNLSKLTWSVRWNTSNSQTHTVVVRGNDTQVQNTVTVALSYVWIPEGFVPSKTMHSTSVAVMSF